jgi:hypothetical protein
MIMQEVITGTVSVFITAHHAQTCTKNYIHASSQYSVTSLFIKKILLGRQVFQKILNKIIIYDKDVQAVKNEQVEGRHAERYFIGKININTETFLK